MKESAILKNPVRFGLLMGFAFPIMAIVIDLLFKNLLPTPKSIAVLYTTNPLHWVILSAPLVLGVVCKMLGNRIQKREAYLKELTENEKRQTSLIEDYIVELGNRNLAVELSPDFENKSLSTVLTSLRDNLASEKRDAERRQWTNEGLARFAEILRSHENINELGYAIISSLVKYLKCNQGGLFLAKEGSHGVVLELTGCYAYERRKVVNKNIEIGQGMLGQCFVEGQTTLLYDVPSDYVHITSGLGEATPKCLILVPLKTDKHTEGVVEIAGFRKFEQYEVEFIEKVCESIASVFSSAKINEQTRELLSATQAQAEMMRSQEEEMRQNMEELTATQEEMYRKEKQYVSQINKLEKLLITNNIEFEKMEKADTYS